MKTGKKILALIIIVFFTLTSSVFAAPQCYSIRVPEEHGKVTQRYRGKSDETIIHIQDAHASFDAQQSLSKILEYFSLQLPKDENAEKPVIGIEGASGPVELTEFKEFPLAKVRRRVAEKFVKDGIFTGSELAAIASDEPITLHGLEDESLFIQNFRSFYNVSLRQSELETEIAQLEGYLDDLKVPIYNEDLKAFDKEATLYERNQGLLMHFLGVIYQTMDMHDIDILNYMSLMQFQEVYVLEKTISFKVLDLELGRITKVLKETFKEADPPFANDIEAKYQAYLKKEITQQYITNYVYAQAIKKNVFSVEYKHMDKAVQYWRKYGSVDIGKLMNDVIEVAQDIRLKLAQTNEERLLIKTAHRLMKVKQLCALKALKQDVMHFRAHREAYGLQSIVEDIKGLASKANVSLNISDSTFNMNRVLDMVDAFYTAAEKRDEAMVANLIKEMQQQKTKTGVLVAGGYHSDGVINLLKEKGISYVTVTPQINDLSNQVAYMDRMMGNIAPLSPQMVSHFRKSQLNAILREIADQGYLQQLLNRFNATVDDETISNIDFAAEFVLQNHSQHALARTLYDLAQDVAENVATLNRDDITGEVMAMTIGTQYAEGLTSIINSLHAENRPLQADQTADEERLDTLSTQEKELILRQLKRLLHEGKISDANYAVVSEAIRNGVSLGRVSGQTIKINRSFIENVMGRTGLFAQNTDERAEELAIIQEQTKREEVAHTRFDKRPDKQDVFAVMRRHSQFINLMDAFLYDYFTQFANEAEKKRWNETLDVNERAALARSVRQRLRVSEEEHVLEELYVKWQTDNYYGHQLLLSNSLRNAMTSILTQTKREINTLEEFAKALEEMKMYFRSNGARGDQALISALIHIITKDKSKQVTVQTAVSDIALYLGIDTSRQVSAYSTLLDGMREINALFDLGYLHNELKAQQALSVNQVLDNSRVVRVVGKKLLDHPEARDNFNDISVSKRALQQVLMREFPNEIAAMRLVDEYMMSKTRSRIEETFIKRNVVALDPNQLSFNSFLEFIIREATPSQREVLGLHTVAGQASSVMTDSTEEVAAQMQGNLEKESDLLIDESIEIEAIEDEPSLESLQMENENLNREGELEDLNNLQMEESSTPVQPAQESWTPNFWQNDNNESGKEYILNVIKNSDLIKNTLKAMNISNPGKIIVKSVDYLDQGNDRMFYTIEIFMPALGRTEVIKTIVYQYPSEAGINAAANTAKDLVHHYGKDIENIDERVEFVKEEQVEGLVRDGKAVVADQKYADTGRFVRIGNELERMKANDDTLVPEQYAVSWQEELGMGEFLAVATEANRKGEFVMDLINRLRNELPERRFVEELYMIAEKIVELSARQYRALGENSPWLDSYGDYNHMRLERIQTQTGVRYEGWIDSFMISYTVETREDGIMNDIRGRMLSEIDQENLDALVRKGIIAALGIEGAREFYQKAGETFVAEAEVIDMNELRNRVQGETTQTEKVSAIKYSSALSVEKGQATEAEEVADTNAETQMEVVAVARNENDPRLENVSSATKEFLARKNIHSPSRAELNLLGAVLSELQTSYYGFVGEFRDQGGLLVIVEGSESEEDVQFSQLEEGIIIIPSAVVREALYYANQRINLREKLYHEFFHESDVVNARFGDVVDSVFPELREFQNAFEELWLEYRTTRNLMEQGVVAPATIASFLEEKGYSSLGIARDDLHRLSLFYAVSIVTEKMDTNSAFARLFAMRNSDLYEVRLNRFLAALDAFEREMTENAQANKALDELTGMNTIRRKAALKALSGKNITIGITPTQKNHPIVGKFIQSLVDEVNSLSNEAKEDLRIAITIEQYTEEGTYDLVIAAEGEATSNNENARNKTIVFSQDMNKVAYEVQLFHAAFLEMLQLLQHKREFNENIIQDVFGSFLEFKNGVVAFKESAMGQMVERGVIRAQHEQLMAIAA